MARYRKKPVVIEAVRCEKEMTIPTLEGLMVARPGDWIIKGIKGELYPCKPDIFEATYEPAEMEKRTTQDALRACGVTVDEINALPDRIREYIHDVSTLCDPAGMVQEIAALKDQVGQLSAPGRDGLRLRYCKRHRTIVPAFKDQPLSCCVWHDQGWRDGQKEFQARIRLEPDGHTYTARAKGMICMKPPGERGP